MSNGITIYEGPSELDGAPIIAVATGIVNPSSNPKTGPMIQVWIIRSDIAPHDATKTGADAAICGDCRHKGQIVNGKLTGRTCYVTPFQAPLNVFKSFHRGLYPVQSLDVAAEIFDGRRVRIGAYGDPAAVPANVWERTLSRVSALTGYTHAWRYCAPVYAQWCMASADSALERELANAKGYRVFRVKSTAEPRLKGEVVCPASDEAGKRTNCHDCRACGGLLAKARADIVINAHGMGAATIERNASKGGDA